MKKASSSLGISLAIIASFFLSAAPAVHAAAPCPFSWTATLKLGSTGSDVLKLQQFLNADPKTTVALSGPGSSGEETVRFGALTKKAVINFQEQHAAEILVPNGLTSGNGVVGPSTRAVLNGLCREWKEAEAGAVLGAATGTAALTVAPGVQPARTITPANALYTPYTNFSLTAGSEDVTVNKITVSRVGPAKNELFSYLSLLDEDGSYLGDGYLHADSSASFRDPFVVQAGTTRNLTVAGNTGEDLTAYDGQAAGFEVVSIEASAPLSGLLPIRGTLQTANSSLVVGTVYASLSGDDPHGARTVYINDAGVRFSGIRLEADAKEDERLYSITWDQAGSAGAHDIANVRTVVNGASYPAETDGKSYTSTFGSDGILIQKGQSLDLSVVGDPLPSAVNRKIKFDIRFGTDIYTAGARYGFGTYTIPGGNTATDGQSVFLTEDGTTDTGSLTPFFSGSEFTISGGVIQSISR